MHVCHKKSFLSRTSHRRVLLTCMIWKKTHTCGNQTERRLEVSSAAVSLTAVQNAVTCLLQPCTSQTATKYTASNDVHVHGTMKARRTVRQDVQLVIPHPLSGPQTRILVASP
eukprot:scpid105131/ scgid6833/ 